MSTENTIVLMSRSRIERSLQRIAYQIVEETAGAKDISLLGIDRRGKVVADYIREQLEQILGEDIGCSRINIKHPEEQASDEYISDDSNLLVLVDDVIFSGRTMFKALTELDGDSLPGQVYCAVLVDRGHRKVPVMAHFQGIEIPTKLKEHVSVRLDEQGALQDVVLILNES